MQKRSEQELQELASQLSHPKGENGIATAKSMNVTNDNMIRKTIGCIDFRDDQHILEIGPGNGSHLPYLFEKNNTLYYTGIDISELMVSEAKTINEKWINYGQAAFEITNGENIEKPNSVYDAVFTVNTLYFWKNPTAFLGEIYRVLKSNSQFVIAFIPKNTMEKFLSQNMGLSCIIMTMCATYFKNPILLLTAFSLLMRKFKAIAALR